MIPPLVGDSGRQCKKTLNVLCHHVLAKYIYQFYDHSATDKAADSIADIFPAKQRPYKQAKFERAELDAYAFPKEQMSESQSHHSATNKAANSIASIFQAQQCSNK
jgi:hypothetical protein